MKLQLINSVVFLFFCLSWLCAVTIFIESNHGAETTYLHGLQIFGTPMDIKRGMGGIRFRIDGVDVNM